MPLTLFFPTNPPTRPPTQEDIIEVLDVVNSDLSNAKLIIGNAFETYCEWLPHGYLSTHNNCSHYAEELSHRLPSFSQPMGEPLCCPTSQFENSSPTSVEMLQQAEILKHLSHSLEVVIVLEDCELCSAAIDDSSCPHRECEGDINSTLPRYFYCNVKHATQLIRDSIDELRSVNNCICRDQPPTNVQCNATHDQRLDGTLAVLYASQRYIAQVKTILGLRTILMQTGFAF